MPADEVGVQVRLDHVLDPETVFGRFDEVLIDVTLRIDDSRLTAIADQVRRVGQAAEVELLEVHGWRSEAANSL